MTTVLSLKDKNDDLLIVPGDLAVLAAPLGVTIPTALTDDDGSLLPLPAGWLTAGEINQKGGAGLSPDTKTTDLMGYGSMVPRRTIKTAEGLSVDFTADEVRKLNLGLFWGQDLSSVTADSVSGEWQFKKTAQARMQYWSLILLALDENADGDVFSYWILPKTSVTKSGKIPLQMDANQSYPITLTAYDHKEFGGYVAIGQGGLGGKALNAAQGFAPLVKTATITGTPTGGTFTLTFAGQTTSGIAYNAAAAAVQTALAALSTVGVGNVTVSGSAGGPYTISFSNVTGTLTASGTSLTPSGGVTVS
jgi:hypothetical protein